MNSTIRALAALVVAGAVAGCATGRAGPTLPSFEDPVASVESFTRKTDRAHRVIQRDLGRLEELQKSLRQPPDGLLAEPFPLDLFRHVLMACLNARTSTEVSRGTNAEQLQCQPRFIDELQSAVDDRVPNRRKATMAVLEKADAFQRLRGRLRRRLTKIPRLVRTNRDTLASRRAELANRRESLQDQKTEYSTSRWREVSRRLAAYRNALNKLEHVTNQLDTSDEVWPERVEKINHDLYLSIARQWTCPDPDA